ncbi:MAG: glycosyltransferase family 4 protein [Halorhabdus sp.]
MRICLLSKMFPPISGGSSMYAYEIANALGERGHDVDVYTQSKAESESTMAMHDNVSVHTLTKSRKYLVTFETLYYSLRVRSVVDLDDYDVIHGTLMPASTIALSDRLTFDTPIVLTSHSFALSEVFAHSPEKLADYLLKYAFHPMNVVMDNISARRVDKIIAISEEMREQIVNSYRIDEDSVIRISHGVDTDRYRPREEVHEAVSDDKLTLLFVGRLITRKGVDLAIRSLAAMENEEAELLIAGSGRLEDQLKQLAQELGVAGRVRFLGYVPDVELPLLYSSADLTLFTSEYEGFGLVLLESLASGTPVVGPPVGGVPDILENGVSGYIVDRKAQAFASKIDYICNHPQRLREMSDAARVTATERSWSRVAREVEDLYEEVVDASVR